MQSTWMMMIFSVVIVVLLMTTDIGVDAHLHRDQLPWEAARSGCSGTIDECINSAGGELDEEINRRILATTNYISYGALQRNTVPCSHRGASYYNCKTGAEANPYTRGCSAITRCRS
ncbi:protein RALF-like 33 [Impatiens glandulifera]|uniref:protein RALF-like 33 n=1 Tax=Impatiens glandulifera TaxID=253017 RepID=UPI001FB07FA2|nr:protein RALF-like 33 [Impatiens glandulifera]